jgi:hypothetical protein
VTSDARIDRVVELRTQGLSLRSSAALLGVGYGTVRRDLTQWEQQTVAHWLDAGRTPDEPPQVNNGDGEP